jgi:hypothetical protein
MIVEQTLTRAARWLFTHASTACGDTLSDTLRAGRKRKATDESARGASQNQGENTLRIAVDSGQSFS